MTQEVYHIPALLPQTLEALDIRPDGKYIDATFGGGGHSRAIVDKLGPDGHLYSFDQDEDALKNAIDSPIFTMVYGNFRFISNFMRYYGVEHVDGILADLGVSFHHFDDASRGFSFRSDGALDMRMNRHATKTAATILQEYSEQQLANIFYLYGELKQSRRIASAIVAARQKENINTVGKLIAICTPLINPQKEKKELACIFQALRIEVNGELDVLRSFLEQSVMLLDKGGRLAILTYHSLEDRLVKNFMKFGNFEGEPRKDFFGKIDAPLKQLTSKPIVPSDNEIAVNPRSRSAKLRVAEKI
ncbi:MAG: 16S rRNA (cytosine(1402)-N(4))-methyltransferase RsmH [Muribaculaceae bacterium]|nr:16S rRNA (cytosine(1402)-N(4))-methyltransferase RsmH [Muribaculaceae bacterium]